MIATALFLAAALAQPPPPPEAKPDPAPAASAAGLPVLTLEQALAQARENNWDLKAARARLEQSRLISRRVWASYLPQISLGASYVRNSTEAKFALPTGYFIREAGPAGQAQNGPAFDPSKPIGPENPPGAPATTVLFPSGFAEMTIQPFNQVGAQLQLNQALIVPALYPAIRNAYFAEEVADLSVQSAEREVLFAVAQLYYGAAGLREAIAVQRRLLEANLAHERDAQIRLEAGALPRIGLVRAQIDRARSEQDVVRAENAYASAKTALATLLGRQPDFEVARPEPVQPPEGDAQKLLQTASERRPDLKVARASEELAERNRGAVYYKYAPNLFLTGTWRIANVKGFTDEYDSWNLGLALSWTLWDGGLREVELKETAARVAEASATLRGAEAKAADEVQRALLDLQSARANRAKAEEQLKLARENAELIEVNFKNGAATQLDVTDATTALAAAEINIVAETLNSQLAALKLAMAVGLFEPGAQAAK